MAAKRDRAREFDEYFHALYNERWLPLKNALLLDVEKRTLANPFEAGLADYSLDPASLLPVRYLDVRAGERIADFCASPGGKSLASLFAIQGRAEWHCNDLSPARVARLRAVFHDSLPAEIFRNVHVSCSDASRWGLRRAEEFDKVLIDAPCSGERHLLQRPAELARWSLKGVKSLVVRQHALLCSGLDCLKPGGRLVYSTCSINPLENDGVIQRLVKSRPGKFKILQLEDALGEPTQFGRIVLPDRSHCGPIYASALERTDG